MNKQAKVKALQERERECRYPIGRKSVVVWHYITGKYKSMYQVCCSIYPELGGMFYEREKALQRAQNIVSYHNRQLELPLDVNGVELNSSKKV